MTYDQALNDALWYNGISGEPVAVPYEVSPGVWDTKYCSWEEVGWNPDDGDETAPPYIPVGRRDDNVWGW